MVASLDHADLIPGTEIMNDDGTMARLPELVSFAQFHNLKIGTIADLIAYRRVHDHMIDKLLDEPFESRFGADFRVCLFRNSLDGAEYPALVKGEVKADRPTLVRMHRVSVAHDLLGGAGHRGGLLERSIREIAAEDGAGDGDKPTLSKKEKR